MVFKKSVWNRSETGERVQWRYTKKLVLGNFSFVDLVL